MEADRRQTPDTSFALLCDTEGKIIQVIRDEVGLAGRAVPGSSLLALVDQESVEKAVAFLAALRRQQAAFDWELNLSINGEPILFHFAGGLTNNNLLVIGAQSRTALTYLYEEMALINNEQANVLRTVLKEQALQARLQAERDNDLYDELSRLNNELTTLQRELAKKNVILEKLNEQKNQFLGMAAHDLRNPLGIIQSYSEFLLDEAAAVLSDEHLQFIETIHTSSEFMLGLVNNLLDVTAIESGKLKLDLQPANLIDLIASNMALNQVLAAKKQIELKFYAPDSCPTLLVDAAKIQQVLNNLLTNAIKFSYPGQTVAIRLTGQGESVEVSVQDNGPGIPAEELDKLFKPFARTSVKATAGEKGTGLGLVIARRVVEGHGGKIWVESQPSHGSTFYFSIPVDGMLA